LGHSARELERLSIQARLVDSITRGFLRDGGIVEGMADSRDKLELLTERPLSDSPRNVPGAKGRVAWERIRCGRWDGMCRSVLERRRAAGADGGP
jgi:hypothetical protein